MGFEVPQNKSSKRAQRLGVRARRLRGGQRAAGALLLALLVVSLTAATVVARPLGTGSSAIPALEPAPTVASITPSEGPAAGGTEVKIKGTGFVEPATVTIGSAATSVHVVSETEITAKTPAHAPGAPEVVVEDSHGKSTAGPTFTYLAAPTVASVSPSSGPESGGTSVTITGENLAGATEVRFGASAATSVTINSSTSITATSPAGSGKVDVTVTTAGGTSTTSPADAFTYLPPPPPKEKEPPPPAPPPAAATCKMQPIFLTIERKRKGKARPKITAGQLRVTVTCTDSASVGLAGRLSVIGKKPKRGKASKKTYILGPSTVSTAKGVGVVVALKLPLNTVVKLVAKAKESVRITLTATSAGGSSHNGVIIKQLKV